MWTYAWFASSTKLIASEYHRTRTSSYLIKFSFIIHIPINSTFLSPLCEGHLPPLLGLRNRFIDFESTIVVRVRVLCFFYFFFFLTLQKTFSITSCIGSSISISDHFPIHLNYSVCLETISDSAVSYSKWSFRSHLFTTLAGDLLDNLPLLYFDFSSTQVDLFVSEFYSCLLAIVNQCLSRKNSKRAKLPRYYSSHSVHLLNKCNTEGRRSFRQDNNRLLRLKQQLNDSIELDLIHLVTVWIITIQTTVSNCYVGYPVGTVSLTLCTLVMNLLPLTMRKHGCSTYIFVLFLRYMVLIMKPRQPNTVEVSFQSLPLRNISANVMIHWLLLRTWFLLLFWNWTQLTLHRLLGLRKSLDLRKYYCGAVCRSFFSNASVRISRLPFLCAFAFLEYFMYFGQL